MNYLQKNKTKPITLVAQVVLADSSVAGRTLRTRASVLVGRLPDPVSPDGDHTAGSEPITGLLYNPRA